MRDMHPGEALRILVVEDQPTDFHLAILTLEDSGRVVEGRRVETEEALRSELGSFSPDLILLDMDLPRLDGISALGITGVEAPEIPVIMFTGSLDRDTVARCMERGAVDFVPKSHLPRLPAAVSAALEAKQERAGRERAESERRESDKRFRLLADTTPDPILVTTGEGIIQYANRAATLTFGYGSREFLGTPLDRLFAPMSGGHLPTGRSANGIVLSGLSNAVAWQVWGIRKDGERIPLEVSSSRSGPGEGADFFFILRDISERRASEEALEGLVEQHDLILNSVAEGILVVDRMGKGVFANAAALEATGWDEWDILGRDIHETLHCRHGTPEVSREKCPVLAPLDDHVPRKGETTFCRKDGSNVEVSFSASPFSASLGVGDPGSGGLVVVFQDVTERKQLEQQLRQAQKMEAVGLLTGGIAHDFNNLLSVILLQTEAMKLALDASGSSLSSNLEDIHTAAERAADMTGKLLGFSRQAPLKLAPLDVARVVLGVGPMLKRFLPETIEFTISAEKGGPAVRADAGALEQIILNLVTNARDAMKEGGELRIEVTEVACDEEEVAGFPWAKPGSFVRVSVQDTGHGIEEATLGQVFDPFFTTKARGEGTGLGLAMVYGLARQHDGFAQVESEVGRGTVVRLFLPVADEESVQTVAKDDRAGPLTGTETILVVEDEPGLRTVATRALEMMGYSVLQASNGEEAVSILRASPDPPDLVLTDVVMPKMGGMTLFQRTREEGLRVPFLFTSGYLVGGEEGVTFSTEDAAFIAKPWRHSELLRRIRDLLDGTDGS